MFWTFTIPSRRYLHPRREPRIFRNSYHGFQYHMSKPGGKSLVLVVLIEAVEGEDGSRQRKAWSWRQNVKTTQDFATGTRSLS
jgi:hypothetical protein